MRAILVLPLLCASLVGAGEVAERKAFSPWPRARHDPLQLSLAGFAYQVLHPGDSLAARRRRAAHAEGDLVAAEVERPGTLSEWDAKVPGILAQAQGYLNAWDTPMDETRDVRLMARNRIEHRILVERELAPEHDRERARYLVFTSCGQLPELAKLARQANHPLADHLAVTVARLLIKQGDYDTALGTLRAFGKRFPASPKRDEVAYLLALRGLWKTIGPRRRKWFHRREARKPRVEEKPVDPLAISAALDGYREAWPEGRWRHRARGWQAHLRYRFPEAAWGGDGGMVAAARIYEDLLLEPDSAGMFNELVFSLRASWGKLDPGEALSPDPKLALVRAWLTERGKWKHREAVNAAKAAVVRVDDVHLRCCLALLSLKVDPAADAVALVEALPEDGGGLAAYLRGRLCASRDDVGGAMKPFEQLAKAASPYAARLRRDLGTRIGGACERLGRWDEALEWYRRAGDGWNLSLCAGGEMPLDELVAWLGRTEAFTLEAWRKLGPPDERDLRPVMQRAAVGRLLAVGRIEEAVKLGLPEPDAEAHDLEVFKLQQRGRHREAKLLQPDPGPDVLEALARLVKAAESGEAADLYALGAFWYKRGQALLQPEPHWAKYHFYRWPPPELQGEKVDPALKARWKEREKLLLATNACAKALPYFVKVAEGDDAEHAPKALYSAALCCWWLRRDNKQLMEWQGFYAALDKDGKLTRTGDDFMLQLVTRFPDHELAKSPWAQRAAARARQPAKPARRGTGRRWYDP